MFTIITGLMGLMALINLLAIASGRHPTVRQIAGKLEAMEDGRDQLQIALVMSGLVQVFLISLIFPLKALHFELALAWSLLMLISVLETIYTARKMKAVVTGEDASGRFPLHDSPWYMAYQIVYNLAIIGVCVVLVMGPR